MSRAIVDLLLEQVASLPPELKAELSTCLHDSVERNAYFVYARELHARLQR